MKPDDWWWRFEKTLVGQALMCVLWVITYPLQILAVILICTFEE